MPEDNEYLDLMNSPPQPPAVAPDEAAKAIKLAPKAGVPASVIAGDTQSVNDMVGMRHRDAISKTDPNMARWAQANPMHVAASADQSDWLQGFGRVWDAVKSFAYVPPDQREPYSGSLARGVKAIPGEAVAEAKAGVKQIAGLDQPTDMFGMLNKLVTTMVPSIGAAQGVLQAAFSPLTATAQEVIGRPLEAATGLRKQLTGQILSMLVPLGAAAKGAKFGEAGKVPHPEVETATQNVSIMDAMHSAVAQSELQTRSPTTMAEFIKQQTEGTPVESVSIDPKTVLEAYTKAGHAPFAEDGMLGWIPDLRMKLIKAVKSGQDLTVPVADYLTNVDEAGHAALRNGLSLGEAKSLRDADAVEATDQKEVVSLKMPPEFEGWSPIKFDTNKDISIQNDNLSPEATAAYKDLNDQILKASGLGQALQSSYADNAIFARNWHVGGENGTHLILNENWDRVAEIRELKGGGYGLNVLGNIIPERFNTYSEAVAWVLGEDKGFEPPKTQPSVQQPKAKTEEPSTEVPSPAKAVVEKAKKDYYLSPLFLDAKSAGMSETQFALYSKRVQESDAALYAKVQDLATKQIERERSKEWSARAGELDPVVRTELASNPAIAARHFLSTGEDISGTGLSAVKLDRASVKEAFPSLVDDLPRSIFGKNGVDADSVAEVFGFRNGESMLRAIDNLERVRKTSEAASGKMFGVKGHYEELVKNEVSRRLRSELGDYLSDSEIDRAMREAVNEPAVTRLLTHELETLAKQWISVDPEGVARLGKLPLNAADIRGLAEDSFRDMRTVDAANIKKIEKYIGRHGRDAEVALLKGKYAEAFQAKQHQLINQHMLALAHTFQKEFLRGGAKYKSLAKSASIAGVDQEYLNYIHGILGSMQYPLAADEMELAKILQAKPLIEFIEQNRAAGTEIPYEGITAKPIKEMTVGEFRANRATITALEHIGRFWKTVDVLGKKIEFGELLDRLAEQRARIGDTFTTSELRDPSFKGKIAAALRKADSGLMNMEFLFDKLDGNDLNGVFNQTIVRPMQSAKHAYDDMASNLAKAFNDFSETMPKGWEKTHKQRIEFPLRYEDADGELVPVIQTKRQLLGAALHWGNAENKWKLIKGFAGESEEAYANWERALGEAFDRHMTKADWDFVQFYWDQSEALWERARDMHKELNGVAPLEVRPESFSTPHGMYRGGHAPIFYDALLSPDVAYRAGEDALFGNTFLRALPSKSYTIKRTGYTSPLELDLDVVKGRFGQMMHDVAFRPALLNADKFLRNTTVERTMNKMVGPEYTTAAREWLKRIAGAKDFDDRGTSWWNNFVQAARSNQVSMAILYRMSTIFKHGPTAYAKSADEIGMDALTHGFSEMQRGMRVKGYSKFIEDIYKESPELKRRLINLDRDFRDAFQKLFQKQGYLSQLQVWGAYGVGYSDQLSAIPTYLGAKQVALEKGLSLSDAIDAGEKAVRRAHGASSPVDLPAILDPRGPFASTWKLFTPFMTFMNNGYNRIRSIGSDITKLRKHTAEGETALAMQDFGRIASRSFWVIAMPALIEQAVQGEITKKHWLRNFGRSITFTAAAGIPLVREATDALFGDYDYKMTPIEQGVGQLIKDTKSLLLEQKVPPKPLRHLLEDVGLITGAPTGQLAVTSQYLWDMNTGKEHPKNALAVARGLALGSPRKE